MKTEDFCDKYILREGDLLPVRIGDYIGGVRFYTEDFFKELQEKGFVFDNPEEAHEYYRCMMGAIKKPFDERILKKQTYEYLKEQAIKNLIEGPQKTLIKEWEAERKYKISFDRVLKRDGFVTSETLAEELGKPETIRFSSDEAKKRIYISGPISGHNIEERRKAFKEIQSQLEVQGYDPVNPMENGLPAEATTHEHMKRDIDLLMTCDYIYMMRRWTHSKGCKVEFDVATAIGLPVLFEESGELIEFE